MLRKSRVGSGEGGEDKMKAHISIPEGYSKLGVGEQIKTGDFCIDYEEGNPFELKLTWTKMNLRDNELWFVGRGDLIIRKVVGAK